LEDFIYELYFRIINIVSKYIRKLRVFIDTFDRSGQGSANSNAYATLRQ
jgi:hypothetical protein